MVSRNLHELLSELTIDQKLELGNWDTPITQRIASQVGVYSVINATDLGGTVIGGYFGVRASVALTGDLRGARARATVLTGITLTGTLYGLHIETEVLGTGVLTSLHEGIRIEQYVESGATISASGVYGIHIANSIASAPSSYYFMRMSENAASTVNAIFHIYRGASCVDMQYLFLISTGAAIGLGATVGACSGTAGYLKIKWNTSDRYIQLYSTSP